MARWTDIAPRQEHTQNQTSGRRQVRGLVVHIAEGSYEGTISWQITSTGNKAVSSHFIVAKDGRICQMVDTSDTAWTQADGNPDWISVENEGYSGTPLTDAQLAANADIFARVCREYGVPLQVTSSTDGRGLGHHAMGGQAWGNHPNCPGSPIINQKQHIVDLAKGGPDMSTKEYADATWNDDIIPTAPSRDDATSNPTTAAKNALSSMWELLYKQQEKIDQIMAYLQSGVPVSAQVDLSPESVASVAKATNDDAAARLAQ
jgi:N-acetylmuramoyl-L-alanine amidase